ncbi:indoleamine -dioxygenase pyrrole -dioxygenase [Ophiostoma piceae UAMH 11346]|uniref:Indoleamine-dioxygenase pyrrole-dioxygenase n=1 Tax=Ophiostoma piceae (strain UAMH 11346) TaxID=1262450 RepID=S3CJ97_OPHP1|nr:indoleamine -dioxygenase pyrrole -dioxygenase [Ophiostoma piceae UAMH 11346]
MQGLLDQYAVSQNGFLPPSLPLACLPDSYYAPWESVISQLPALLKDDAFRTAASRMPVLSTDSLRSEQEWQRAYLVLAFFTHAYIWGGDKPADVLPPPISVPLLKVVAHLELPPVATYAALNLWNFGSTSPSHSFDDLDALHALHTFTGTESESWFYVVSVAMECRAASIVPVLLEAMVSPQDIDANATISVLRQFVPCIQDIGRLLDRMHERCDPQVFFWEIRPYLAGSKNMAAQGLPNGVFYDEGIDEHGQQRGSWQQLRGGSNGQSSLLQFFDIVLGVEHYSNGTAAVAPLGFHEEVRGYMPGPHRRFLEYAGSLQNLRQAVDGLSDSAQKEELVSAFQDATKALAAFRNKHLAIVTRYIVLPSKQKRAGSTNNSGRGLAGTPQASSKTSSYAYNPSKPCTEPHLPSEKFTGTGGTDLLPFLKQTRDETLFAGQSLSQAA